jgi:hypothetical protein
VAIIEARGDMFCWDCATPVERATAEAGFVRDVRLGSPSPSISAAQLAELRAKADAIEEASVAELRRNLDEPEVA